jgi:hypothetical protein
MRIFALAALAACFAGSAFAAPEPDLATLPPKTVAPVTVTPRTNPPKVVSTFPASGQVVAAGVLIVHVTFDQTMDEKGFVFVSPPGAAMPKCLGVPRLLKDEKTFALLCTTETNRNYSLALNTPAHAGVANVSRTRAEPALLAFSTSGEMGPRNLEDALKAAGLTPDDVPIAVAP